MNEVPWTKLFAYDLPAVRPAKVSHECCDACREAKELKCVCTCGGKNHGAALKKDIKRLDDFSPNERNLRPLEYIA